MWNKIYLLAFGVLFVPMVFFTVYSWNWLQSVAAPRSVAENYAYWTGLSWTFLWLSTVALLILANVLLWKTRRAWALWLTFLYFAVFVVLRYFWLDGSFLDYRRANNLPLEAFPVAPLIGFALCVASAVVVFFDQFLVKRLRDKMLGEPAAAISAVSEPLSTEERRQ